VKRELRGFLLGLLVAVLWVVLTAGIGGSEGKYQLSTIDQDKAWVLDSETGEVFVVFTGMGVSWFGAGSPSTREVLLLESSK